MTIILIIFAVLLAFLIYWLFGSNTDLQTVSYTVPTDKVAAPVRIAVVSDLHSCKYGENQSELLDAIAAQSPDAVLMTGDIYDDRLPDEQSDIFLRAAGERFRCYYIPGNHEFRKFENNNIEGLFPKYAGGRYDFDGATLIVSRGLARESTIVPRIFNPPELVVIDILPKDT